MGCNAQVKNKYKCNFFPFFFFIQIKPQKSPTSPLPYQLPNPAEPHPSIFLRLMLVWLEILPLSYMRTTIELSSHLRLVFFFRMQFFDFNPENQY